MLTGFLCLKEAWGTACLLETSCPELQRPQKLAGETSECAPESLEHQKIGHIGGCTFFPSGTRQDFHRKSIQKCGWSFHNRNSSQVPIAGGNPVCCVLQKQGKGLFFFPVEVIYTHFLCHCHWEWCSLHNITAAVFGDSPLPKLGNLTSQSEDDRALCAKPAISQGVK